MYDLVIIGGGPAGVAAGVYASRKRLKTVFITADFNSQSAVSERIENWIGTIALSGMQLAQNLKDHLHAYADNVVSIHEGEKVVEIKKIGVEHEEDRTKKSVAFEVKTDKNTFTAKTVLVATGSYRRKLEIPGAETFDNKGLTYCASCDGPLFSGRDVAVIGGGNAGFETAAQLLSYAKSVTLLHHADTFKADPITVEKVLAHPNMKAHTRADIVEVFGEKFVNGLAYKNLKTGDVVKIPVEGIFVEIGLIPSTQFLGSMVELNSYNQIVVDPKTQRTNTPGIWAAGDCTDGLYHQNNIAAGDAVKALEDIFMYLRAGKDTDTDFR